MPRGLFQGLHADDCEIPRAAGLEYPRVRRILGNDFLQDLLARIPGEGPRQGQRLIERRSQREHVCAVVDPHALRRRLFRAHVEGRPHELPAA